MQEAGTRSDETKGAMKFTGGTHRRVDPSPPGQGHLWYEGPENQDRPALAEISFK